MDFNSDTIFLFIQQHPQWSYAIVALFAAIESLLLVGMFFPGAVAMLAIGTLIATGHLSLWPTLFWAAFGAFVGDNLSYWVGYYFKDHLKEIWPFKNNPHFFDRGEKFFQKHGGKSVVLGRFVGPIRAVIPTVAGMMSMPPRRFVLINFFSALAWAPTYILPGTFMGAAVSILGDVAGRLIVTIVLTSVTLYLTWLLFRAVRRHAYPRFERQLNRIISALHTRLLGYPVAAEDHHARAYQVIFWLMVAIFLIASQVGEHSWISYLDHKIYFALHSSQLQNPLGWQLATYLGDTLTLSLLSLSVFIWLLHARRWRLLSLWVATLLVTLIIPSLLKWGLNIPRPYPGNVIYDSASFVSGHASRSGLIYGTLAIILAHHWTTSARRLLYLFIGLLVAVIGFSRVVLELHWLSDVIAGFFVALTWLLFLNMLYKQSQSDSRHLEPPIHRATLVGLLSLPIAGLIFLGMTQPLNQKPQWPAATTALPEAVFQPTYQPETEPRWFCRQSREQLEQRLLAAGYQPYERDWLTNLLQLLNDNIDISDVTLFQPHWYGQRPSLVWLKPLSSDKRVVIFGWRVPASAPQSSQPHERWYVLAQQESRHNLLDWYTYAIDEPVNLALKQKLASTVTEGCQLVSTDDSKEREGNVE